MHFTSRALLYKWLKGIAVPAPGFAVTYLVSMYYMERTATLPGSGYFAAGTTSASWFPFINDTDIRNVMMIEQTINSDVSVCLLSCFRQIRHLSDQHHRSDGSALPLTSTCLTRRNIGRTPLPL